MISDGYTRRGTEFNGARALTLTLQLTSSSFLFIRIYIANSLYIMPAQNRSLAPTKTPDQATDPPESGRIVRKIGLCMLSWSNL